MFKVSGIFIYSFFFLTFLVQASCDHDEHYRFSDDAQRWFCPAPSGFDLNIEKKYIKTGASSIIIPAARPPPEERRFRSRLVEDIIQRVKKDITSPELAQLFENTLPNTLDTTIQYYDANNHNDSFIITGDIPAMWLRDSTNQVLPYLHLLREREPLRGRLRRRRRGQIRRRSLLGEDPELAHLLRGLSLRQMRQVIFDPYANAFNFDENGSNEHYENDTRKPPMRQPVFEGKYELDSLANVLKLVVEVSQATAKATEVSIKSPKHSSRGQLRSSWARRLHRRPSLREDRPSLREDRPSAYTRYDEADFIVGGGHVDLFLKAYGAIITTILQQSIGTEEQNMYPERIHYTFERHDWREDHHYPNNSVGGGTGLIRSAFRPSDDQTYYDMLIPANLMMIQSLHDVTRFIREALLPAQGLNPRQYQDLELIADRGEAIMDGMSRGVKLYSFFNVTGRDVDCIHRDIIVYELDALGRFLFMDDANAPSLLSVPWLGHKALETMGGAGAYQRMRRLVLSEHYNEWFFAGTATGIRGIGSPHTGKDMIWPMAIIMQALTSDSDAEIATCLSFLLHSANNTGLMHESFHKEDVQNYTRPWFAWANTLFGELILKLHRERPHLLKCSFF